MTDGLRAGRNNHDQRPEVLVLDDAETYPWRDYDDTIYFRMLLAHSQLCYSFSDTDRIGSLECVKRTSPLLIDAAKL